MQASVSEGCVSQIWGGEKEQKKKKKKIFEKGTFTEREKASSLHIYLTSSCEIRRGKKGNWGVYKTGVFPHIHKHKVNWSKNIFRLTLAVAEKVCLLRAFFEELLWGKIIESRWSTLPGSPQSSSSTSSSWWDDAFKMWENVKNMLFCHFYRELVCGRRGRRWEETTLTKRWVTKQKLRKNELCFPAQSLFLGRGKHGQYSFRLVSLFSSFFVLHISFFTFSTFVQFWLDAFLTYVTL